MEVKMKEIIILDKEGNEENRFEVIEHIWSMVKQYLELAQRTSSKDTNLAVNETEDKDGTR